MPRRLPMIPCPPSTQDIGINLANRAKAIDVANYGPPNPRERNDAYWQSIASEWGTTPAEARTMRCGNCSAFDVSEPVMDCIRRGLERDGISADEVIVQAELGYCHAFRFKCAASRTCSAWIVGGPITEYRGAR